MNKIYLTVTVIFLGLAAFVVWHTFGSGQVFAQEEIVKDYHQTMMTGLTSEQKDSMINTMKSHHGENWKEGCNKMMENLDDKT